MPTNRIDGFGKRFFADTANLRTLGLFVFIAVCFFAVAMKNPHFLNGNNLKVIFNDTAILVIAAAAQLLVMLTGNIDISASSIIAFSGFASALIMKNNHDMPLPLLVIIAVGLGLALGLINGIVIAYGEVPAIITTLGTLSIYRGFVYIIGGGGWVVSRDLPKSFTTIANGSFFGIANMIVISILIALCAWFFLGFTRIGRRIYAIGSHKTNALLVGIPVKGYVFVVYSVAGALSGLAGILWCSRYNFAQSTTAVGYEMTIIASCVIGGTSVTGGRGTVPGVALGAFLLSFIINAMNVLKISPFWKMAIQGLIILFAVVFDAYISQRQKR